jgi:SAM-dependent methyltransferase
MRPIVPRSGLRQALGYGAPAAAVVAAGAAALFVELALIRYVPGQVRVLGYFTNFVLFAAFLGFGVGIIAVRRWRGALFPSFLAPVALMAFVLLTALGNLLNVLPSSAEVLFLEYQEHRQSMPLYPFLALSFAVLAACFVPLGHAVGRTLEGDAALWRYGLNLVGSLCGIALFATLSALSAPPWLWMTLAAAFTCVGLREASPRWRIAGIATAVLAAAATLPATRDTVWSPYQKITLAPMHVHPKHGLVPEWQYPFLPESERAEVKALPLAAGFTIRVNDDSYQAPADLSDGALMRYPELGGQRRVYDLPFTLKKAPGRVLILGAGSGNDVAAALRSGAREVHAVEIDPEILRLAERHPERPYADPRVTVHLDDARAFLARDPRKYDLIVFGLLDSHVLLSSRSNLRLDSFVFTRESFALAREHLAPHGVMVVSHAVGTPWFIDRMLATLRDAFGKFPQLLAEGVLAYAVGPETAPGPPPKAAVTILEDDWPFLYLPRRSIPQDYVLAMLLMALISLAAVRGVTGPRWSGIDRHFFALGAGFMLLETRGLGVLALHIGATWNVNAAVFAGVLVMGLAATVIAARLAARANKMPWYAYGLLAALLALSYAVPLSALAALPLETRVRFEPGADRRRRPRPRLELARLHGRRPRRVPDDDRGFSRAGPACGSVLPVGARDRPARPRGKRGFARARREAHRRSTHFSYRFLKRAFGS